MTVTMAESVRLAQKYVKFDSLSTETQVSFARAVSQLNATADTALKIQAYIRDDPQDMFDAETIASFGAKIDSLLPAFETTMAKIVDLIAVKSGTMTLDELKIKYDWLDSAEFSATLS